MNEFYAVAGKVVPKLSETTTTYPSTGGKGGKAARRCHLAFPGSTSSALGKEIGPVLRQRLLIAAVITAAGFTVFFIRNVFTPPEFSGFRGWDLAIQGCVAAVFVLIATVLASHFCLSVRQLRGLEIVFFAILAVYFAFLQGVMFREDLLEEWSKLKDPGRFLRIANGMNILRWFALIVIYGTFVPNTWKRSALFVSIWAAIPLALMSLMCFGCPIMGPHAWQALGDTLILLGVASAIAVFGSWKISELHQEAITARRLGQYQLKELIGSGGMGEVYLGEHTMLRRACAIKLIRADQTRDATNLSRFEREVRAMATLTHWNTVEVYDYGLAEDGTFYYVMEYLPGLSLQELVDRYGPLSPTRTIHFLRQICDALQEAHSIGLIHRDVKPSNVLATERGGIYDVAKLLDFGLVQSVGVSTQDVRLTVQGVVLGSPPYMSPEQALGKELDLRSDIYSVGGLAYFLLTGQPMYERESPMQVLMAHVYEKLTPLSEVPPDVPADLEAVIMKCLNKEPKDRFQDAESLEQTLAQCDSADAWNRHDAAEWWHEHQRKQREVAAVAG